MDVYLFDDYRKFLAACFKEKKKQEAGFTYREFATLAQIKNPGYLHDVIRGKRRLSKRVLERCIDIFNISPVHAEYFRLLVAYAHAKDPVDKQSLRKQLHRRRSYSTFFKLNAAHVRYYEDTTYPLLIAAIETMDFRGDWEQLGAALSPPVAPGKAKKCTEELCEWGLVEHTPDNRYIVVNKFIKPPETFSTLVRTMNRQWIGEAQDALDTVPPDERHMSTILLSVSQSAREQIMNKLERFRYEVFDIVDRDSDASEVMQLSLLYFPRTRGRK